MFRRLGKGQSVRCPNLNNGFISLQFLPGVDGALEVGFAIAADGVALEANRALKPHGAELGAQGGLVVVAAVDSLDELTPVGAVDLGAAGAHAP